MKKSVALSRPQRMPKRVRQGAKGWWYEDERGIDMYLHGTNGVPVHGMVYWSDILRAAQRSSGREVIVKGG